MDRLFLPRLGLAWNPFEPDVPVTALQCSAMVDAFITHIITWLVQSGGFALITGAPGTGKSACLRQLAARGATVADLTVGAISHPTASLTNFYRELGDIFAVPLTPHNRWGGFNRLRQTWARHLEQTRMRPVLLIDEAQELRSDILAELRLLASSDFDSRLILTVVLAGDNRLSSRLQSDDLRPVDSRIRRRLNLDVQATPDILEDCLDHLLDAAGNTGLMTPELKTALTTHSAGNLRTLMHLANALLLAGLEQDREQLDEAMLFDLIGSRPRSPRRTRS